MASPIEQIRRTPDTETLAFARSVVRGLSDTPRHLDCRFLYDARGSQLFERICEQPEYYLTSAESEILKAAASDIAVKTGNLTLIEFGSGSSIKTQTILEAYSKEFGQTCYTPVDISHTILEEAKLSLTKKFPNVSVDPFHGTFEEAFNLFHQFSPSLFLFLGSSIGNFDTVQSTTFWESVCAHQVEGDFSLLGIDITEDREALHAAYNDSAGLSAEFTKNIFDRMNRDFDASIDTDSIAHVAKYNPDWQRVEIFAQFLETQTIDIAPLATTFEIEAGEMILTEISRKFRLKQMVPYLRTFGLKVVEKYIDDNRHFCVLLLRQE